MSRGSDITSLLSITKCVGECALIFFFRAADDAELGVGDEVGDIKNLLLFGYLLVDLDDGILKGEVAGGDHAEGVANLTDDVFTPFGIDLPHHDTVDTLVASGVAAIDGIRKYVFGDTGTTLQEGELANTRLVLHNAGTGKNSIVKNLTLGRDVDTDAKDNVIVDVHVVTNVHLVHNLVVITNDGGGVGGERTCDEDAFADDIAVADDGDGWIAGFILDVLRNGTDNGILHHDVVITHSRSIEDGCVWHDDTVVTDLYITLNVGKGFDLNVLADSGTGIYVCLWTDHNLFQF